MFKSKSKYEVVVVTDPDTEIVTTKYEVYLNGFNYLKFRSTNGWEKICTVDTEEDAKRKCIDIIPQDDE